MVVVQKGHAVSVGEFSEAAGFFFKAIITFCTRTEFLGEVGDSDIAASHSGVVFHGLFGICGHFRQRDMGGDGNQSGFFAHLFHLFGGITA